MCANAALTQASTCPGDGWAEGSERKEKYGCVRGTLPRRASQRERSSARPGTAPCGMVRVRALDVFRLVFSRRVKMWPPWPSGRT